MTAFQVRRGGNIMDDRMRSTLRTRVVVLITPQAVFLQVIRRLCLGGHNITTAAQATQRYRTGPGGIYCPAPTLMGCRDLTRTRKDQIVFPTMKMMITQGRKYATLRDSAGIRIYNPP